MKKRGKLTGMCRALLLAASVTALTVANAFPQDLESLNEQILANPQDAELNFRYARAAEEAGQLRLALAAYERVMINDPGNVEARRGYERIRRMIEPAFTTLHTEVGVRWDSNIQNSDIFEEEDTVYFGRATLIDERSFLDRRWRSIVNVEAEKVEDFDDLDYAFVGAQTGPLIYAAPHIAVIPSVGVATSWLSGDHYFDEVNASVTIEGKRDGASYWTRLRGGYRTYEDDATAEEGPFVELIGGLSLPRILSQSDTLVLVPWVRWSDIEGDTFFFGGEVAPGQFIEYGIEATYNYQVNDHLILSAGGTARQREYTETSAFFSGDDREDTFLAPEAAVTVQNFAPCECAIRIEYQYRDNDSNDFFSDFNGERVQLSLQTRF
jgi:hypothetical protein